MRCRIREPALEEPLKNLTALMQRLIENQNAGRERSPQLIEEDEQLMDDLRERILAARFGKTVETSLLGMRVKP